MNEMLKKGFVRPYIIFQFEDGTTLDTAPPRYFKGFEQDTSCKEACKFTLTLCYVPGNFGDEEATLMHQLLITRVNSRVSYQYGYIDSNGEIVLQDQKYTGMFLQYSEQLDSTTIEYTLSGVASETSLTSTQIDISNFLEDVKKFTYKEQPSVLVGLLCGKKDNRYNEQGTKAYEQLDIVNRYSSSSYESSIKTLNSIAASAYKTNIWKFMQDYDLDIDNSDELVCTSDINVSGDTVHDIFCGKSNSDGTSSSECFSYYSYENTYPEDILQSSLLSSRLTASEIAQLNDISILNRYTTSSYNQAIEQAKKDENLESLMKQKRYVAYFDNIVGSLSGNKKGTFHYVPRERTPLPGDDNIFYYGNNQIESDVISLNVSYDCTVAYATLQATENSSVNIDPNGEIIGGTYSALQTGNLVKNSYPTLSGFSQEALLTNTTLSDALNFPYKASMTILGQIKCNHLLDTIRINVWVNGKLHVGITGDYIITGIRDSLSESGFTTSFDLLRYGFDENGNRRSDYLSNSNESAGSYNQGILDATST